MFDSIKTSSLFECSVEYLTSFFCEHQYPWLMLSKIGEYLDFLFENPPKNFKKSGNNLLIGENVTISPTATLNGRAIIGHGTQIRPGAYIRGNVITGENCVIGNSTEIKNTILLDKVQLPHYNYVGDSILGNKAHLGAGAICSNFKGDGSNIIIHAESDIETGLRKIGAVLGDGADIGCGCVLNPGTIIGKKTRAYPLNSLRGIYGESLIIKSKDNIAALY